jgi:hypothetical protein
LEVGIIPFAIPPSQSMPQKGEDTVTGQTSKPLPLFRAEQGADLFQCADQRLAHTARALDAVTVLTSTGRSLDDMLWINRAGLNDGDRVHDDGDHSVTSRNRDFRLVDFGRRGFGLAHGALRMNAAT